MISPRSIAVVLIDNYRAITSRRFSSYKYIGDPLTIVRTFSDYCVDEILILDRSATKRQKPINLGFISTLISECRAPVAYGGGIDTLDQARNIIALGVEKVVLNTATLVKPHLIPALSSEFGAQSVIASVDICHNTRKGKYQLHNKVTGIQDDVFDFIQRLVLDGIGEVIITDVLRDGTRAGPNLDLIAQLAPALPIPLVYKGGINSYEQIQSCIAAGASATACSTFFSLVKPFDAVLITYKGLVKHV